MNAMRQLGVLLGTLALATGAFGAAATAQTTETFTATVEVSSTLSLTEVAQLDFGQIVVIPGTTRTATLTANGTFTDNSTDGNIVQLGTPSAGAYTIATGAATYSTIAITFPGEISLTNAVAPPPNGTFTVGTFTVGTLAAGSFTNTTPSAADCNTAIALAGGVCDFMTDGNGEITVPLGATIAATPSAPFIDGTYSGQFDLTATFN